MNQDDTCMDVAAAGTPSVLRLQLPSAAAAAAPLLHLTAAASSPPLASSSEDPSSDEESDESSIASDASGSPIRQPTSNLLGLGPEQRRQGSDVWQGPLSHEQLRIAYGPDWIAYNGGLYGEGVTVTGPGLANLLAHQRQELTAEYNIKTGAALQQMFDVELELEACLFAIRKKKHSVVAAGGARAKLDDQLFRVDRILLAQQHEVNLQVRRLRERLQNAQEELAAMASNSTQ